MQAQPLLCYKALGKSLPHPVLSLLVNTGMD